MEPECLEEKSAAQSPPTVDCDVTTAVTSDPPTVDCDATAVLDSDPPTVDCDVTTAVTSDPRTCDRALPVAESLALPVASDDVVAWGAARAPHPGPHILQGIPKAPAKLCGYLHKLGGPLKGWKSRWFVYEERNCHLFYYRTAQDASPLGQIALTDATFGYPLQPDPGTFHIQTPHRTFVLKVSPAQ